MENRLHNDELISRDAAKAKLSEVVNFKLKWTCHGRAVRFSQEELEAIIDQIPAVEPVPLPQKGEWVPESGGYQCNKCFDHALEINGVAIRSNFCPNCGADLRGNDNG